MTSNCSRFVIMQGDFLSQVLL